MLHRVPDEPAKAPGAPVGLVFPRLGGLTSQYPYSRARPFLTLAEIDT